LNDDWQSLESAENPQLPEGSPLPDAEEIPFVDEGFQIDFAIKMTNRYLLEKGVPKVGVRRLHYFIVSLPEPERMVPGRGKKPRPYVNTRNDYDRLSELLVDARIGRRIASKKIVDEKNVALIEMPVRLAANTTWEVSTLPIRELPDLDVDVMPDWDEWVDQINCRPHTSRPVFNNQDYHIVVAIEKATSKQQLKDLCIQYGADLLIFSGQFSVTRVYDVINRARAENKPILLLYISDLDVAGWTMPTAFVRRIIEIYPHDDHKMIRVALTRKQAMHYHLPKAFDPDDKEYEEAKVARFIAESGGRDCIELDALDESILLELLVAELKKYSGNDRDAEEFNVESKRALDEIKNIDFQSMGIEEIHTEYDDVKTEFNEIVLEMKILSERYRNKLDDLNSRKYHIESTVVAAIRGAYGFKEYVWGVS